MYGPSAQPFIEAEIAYHRERIMADFPRSRRPFHFHWPTGLRSGRRNPPRSRPTIKPSPHHATSH